MVGRGVKPRLVLRVAEATYFLDYACVSAMRTVLPFHVQALGSGGFGVGALESLFGLGQVAGALVIGRLSDAAGRRLALLLCFACAMVGYVLVALAMATGSTALFFISRVPAGLSKQTVTLARSLVSDVTPTAQRSTALSRLSACGCFGYAVGPLAGGVLSDAGSGARLAAGCAASFAALAPLVLLVLPETRPDSVTGSRAAESSPAAATQPHAELQAWRKQDVLAALCACALPEAAFVMLTATSLPLVAKQTLGWSSTELGKFNSATGLGAGLFSFAALPRLLRDGRLSDVRALQTGELALCVVSMLMLYAPGSATLWACLPLAVLCASLLRSFPVSLVSKAVSAHPAALLPRYPATLLVSKP